MGEVINLSAKRSDMLHSEPTAHQVHDLPVMPLALGDDQPLSKTLFTLADGRLVHAYASNEHGQQYLVQTHLVELGN